MTKHWTTAEFFRAFESGTLGRKTSHSTLYVVNVDKDTQILMDKNTSDPIAVRSLEGFCVFSITWNSGRKSKVLNEFKPNITMTFEEDDNVEEFDVLDIDGKSHLFRLGSSYLLYDLSFAPKPISVKDFLSRSYTGDWEIIRINEPVFSVEEGRNSLIPKGCPDDALYVRGNIFIPMPKEWEPEPIDKSLFDSLYPPRPWDYGVPIGLYNSNFELKGDQDKYVDYHKALEKYKKDKARLFRMIDIIYGKIETTGLKQDSQYRKDKDKEYVKGTYESPFYSSAREEIDLSDRWYELVRR